MTKKAMKEILIVKPSSLGDILHAFPAVAALAEYIPSARISWLINPAFAGLLEYLPCVNGRIIPFDRKKLGRIGSFAGSFAPLVRELRREKFDFVFDMQGLLRSAFFARIAPACEYYGFAAPKEKAAKFLYSKTLDWPETCVHAVEKNCAAAGALLGRADIRTDYHAPFIAKNAESSARLFPGGRFPQKLISVAPGARWETKKWPPEFFASVIRETADLVPDAVFAILGAPCDRLDGEAVKKLAGDSAPVVDLCGMTSLGELFEITRASACLISNDSGPMHIAPLTGTPVAAVFGPTSPEMTGPYTENKYVAMPEMDCIRCFLRYCDNMVCHDATSPRETAEGVRRIMKG